MQWFFLIERQIYIKLSTIVEDGKEKWFLRIRNIFREIWKMKRCYDLYLNKFEYKENLIDKFI